MKSTLLLRIAAILAFVFAFLHTLGMPWTPTELPAAVALVDSMKSLHFEVLGANRSYWDFYQGFGISITIYLLLQGCTLWFLAGVAKTRAVDVRGIVGVFLAGQLVLGFLTWKYFFLAPTVFVTLIALCLLGALLAARRN